MGIDVLIDLHNDIETASELDLFEVGTDAYARHPSTRILMVGWELGDDPISQWSIEQKEPPAEFISYLTDPRILKWAHNSAFERALFMNVWGLELPLEQWKCTMVWAYGLSLPGALDKLGNCLLLPDEYKKTKAEGTRLIKKFSMPQKITKKKPDPWRSWKTDPEDWEKFKLYNRQDVVAESFIAKKRLHKYPLPESFWDDWRLDQEVNEVGLPIDRKMVVNAAGMVRKHTARIWQELVEITGLENPNSDKQFGPWIRNRGYPYSDLKKTTVKKVLDDPEMSHIHHPLEIRSQLKRTAVKKYLTLEEYIGPGDRLRYSYQFSGASRTGRTAGRGPHFQNPAKPDKALKTYTDDIIESICDGDEEWLQSIYGEPMRALSSVIRGAVCAPDGYELDVADYSQIEARIIAWIARCESMLQVFHNGRDIYRAFGEFLYHKEYDDVTREERDFCKPPVLGCGFRLSGGGEMISPKTGDMIKYGLHAYADTLGIVMTPEECAHAVSVYREAYPEVVQLWYDLEGAAKQVITRGGVERVGYLTFDMKGPFLRMILPNGDALHYLRPKIEKRKTPWGAEKWMLTFEGNEESEDGAKFWGRQATHGGKLAENAAQGIANRILRGGLRKARAAGFPLVGHVHDEIKALVKIGSPIGLPELCKAICDLEDCYVGLPIEAEGYAEKRFRKG